MDTESQGLPARTRLALGMTPTNLSVAVEPTSSGGSERPMKFHFFDADYVERLRCGDAQTEKHFVEYFGALIRLKFGRRLRSPSTIEDLRQETVARVWAALRDKRRLVQPEKLGAFVNSVCNNVLFEHYRKASREIAMEEEVEMNIPDLAKDATSVIAETQVREAMRDTLNRLSKRDRFLLEELFLNERDKDDVCQELCVNREYLRVLLFRAKKSFRIYLERHASESNKEAITACQLVDRT
jgi:RNA polymerase sigma-70 factor, ECF subfamily